MSQPSILHALGVRLMLSAAMPLFAWSDAHDASHGMSTPSVYAEQPGMHSLTAMAVMGRLCHHPPVCLLCRPMLTSPNEARVL